MREAELVKMPSAIWRGEGRPRVRLVEEQLILPLMKVSDRAYYVDRNLLCAFNKLSEKELTSLCEFHRFVASHSIKSLRF